MFEAGYQTPTGAVPDYLESKAVSLRARSQPHSRGISGSLDPLAFVRDPDAGPAIDSLERATFLRFNKVMQDMITADQDPRVDELTKILRVRFFQEAEALFNNSLAGFFAGLTKRKSPRLAIQIAMGTGKTQKAIERFKQSLASKYSQNIEVYVPRLDLADE